MACFCQNKFSAVAPKELVSKLCLKRFYLRAEAALRGVQLFRGGGDTAQLRDRKKIVEMIKISHRRSVCTHPVDCGSSQLASALRVERAFCRRAIGPNQRVLKCVNGEGQESV